MKRFVLTLGILVSFYSASAVETFDSVLSANRILEIQLQQNDAKNRLEDSITNKTEARLNHDRIKDHVGRAVSQAEYDAILHNWTIAELDYSALVLVQEELKWDETIARKYFSNSVGVHGNLEEFKKDIGSRWEVRQKHAQVALKKAEAHVGFWGKEFERQLKLRRKNPHVVSLEKFQNVKANRGLAKHLLRGAKNRIELLEKLRSQDYRP